MTLLRHAVDLLAARDPMTYQAIATPDLPVYDSYDPSDEAEIQRMKERGVSDSAIYDEWSDEDSGLDAIRSEIFGE